MITCGFGRSEKAREIDKSDEELINDAKQVLDKLISSGVIGGEYECCGIVSDVTNETDESHKYFVQKRIGFRRKIDGMRIVGNEFCDMVMNAEGLYRIELCCYDYEKIETFEMLTVDQALEKAKKPDAYSVYSATNNNFSGQADVMRIENSNLVYYNQYRKDCIILQPVYYFEGQLVNEKGSVDFSVKIIAIPEKYTYEKNN